MTVYWSRIRVLSSPSEGRPLAAVTINDCWIPWFINSELGGTFSHSDLIGGFHHQHSQISTLRSALSDQHSQISTLRSALSEQYSQISTLRSALSDQYSQISTLRSTFSDQHSQTRTEGYIFAIRYQNWLLLSTLLDPEPSATSHTLRSLN